MMANLLKWDVDGERFYETGVKNAVLYVKDSTGKYGNGVAWSGITGVTESPSGAEATALYADDIKYLNLISAEELGATITTYQYPAEFAVCDGSVELVPGVIASPSERNFSTINDSPEAIEFSWEINTTPVNVPGYKPTALITIDSTKVAPAKLAAIETILYGTEETSVGAGDEVAARLPLPEEVMTILAA